MSRVSLFKVVTIMLVFVTVGLIDLASSVLIPYDRPATTRKSDVFVISSPTRVHQFIPNSTFVLDGATCTTSGLGFRDRNFDRAKPAGVLRVAMLGDSFIEGLGEKQEAAIPKVLERRLSRSLGRPVEVMNCGVRGGSPAVYRWWLRFLSGYSPDAAVVCVFDNDMDDDACALLIKAHYRAAAWYGAPPLLRRSNIFSYLQGELAALRFKSKRRAISREVFKEDDFHRDKKRSDGAPFAVGTNSFGFLEEPERWAGEWKRTESNLNDVVDYSRSRALPLIIVHIPADIQFPRKPGTSKQIPLKRDFFGEWLASWAKEKAVPFLDLSAPLADWYRDPKNPPLYQSTHAHFNEQGLEKAAEWIEPPVKAALF